MGDCTRGVCMESRRGRYERPYRSVPRQMRYSTYPIPEETKYRSKRRSPVRCDSCGRYEGICPCPPPCPDTPSCLCAGQTDSGLLYTIRNRFQKFFSGNRKFCCESMKGKVYNYSPNQLRCLEQTLDRLEEEAYCLEALIRQGLDGENQVSFSSLQYTLSDLMEQAELSRCDLLNAYDCYDPCRDRSEYEMISCLLDRVGRLSATFNDLGLQLECLEHESNYYSGGVGKCCKPNCRKPCCYRPPRGNFIPSSQPRNTTYYNRHGEIGCKKQCCAKPVGYETFFKPVCEVNNKKSGYTKQTCRRGNGNDFRSCLGRTSSVIPVGVMLVKL